MQEPGKDRSTRSFNRRSVKKDRLTIKEDALVTSLLKILPQGVVLTDGDGFILDLNPSAEALLGYCADDIIGVSLLDLHVSSERRRVKVLLQRIQRRVVPQGSLGDIRRNDRHLELKLCGIEDGDGNLSGIVALYLDHTQVQNLNCELERLRCELAREQKLSAIGVLASGIAHNLNGPLSVIVGYLDLLFAKHPEMEEIPLILSQTERMKEIIATMMIKSRQDQDDRRRLINLNALLKNELKFLEANLYFKHQVEKVYDFDPGVPDIYGVYSDFSQCFLNLINNALDAMADSSVKRLTVRTRADADNITVEIEDTGCGLDPENIEKIFDPFFSTKPPVSEADGSRPTGTGLGLSTTRRIISEYRGTITADGSPGNGAKFTIVIPIAENQPPRDRDTVSEHHPGDPALQTA